MSNHHDKLHKIGAAIKYNPHLWSAEELRSIFIARKKELQQVLDIITQTEVSTAPQHTLITGQRGMGKSTLLQRVALAIEEDEGLSKVWLPLRFPEEQYTVTTLAELWANVLNALADTLEDAPDRQREIDNFLDLLENEEKEKREKIAINFLQTWCNKYQLRLLLLMDSTDLLLSNLSHSGKKKKADAGASQLWRLRDTLQNNPCFFWLGGSYQPVDAEALYHDTFLDFFYNIELKPLSLKEMRDAMRELAKTFGIGRGLSGEDAVIEIDRIFDEQPARLKVLRRLSGGNLRTTVMLYELLSAGGDNNVQADLKRLLDLMTPLYKSRIEALADQPRKVLAHLFEHWAPISLGELADISGLEKTSLSPQLQRLELEGLIEKTQLPNTSRKGYQVTERFFNIWYLMRNAPRRLRLRLNYLITFMRLWFNTEELTELATQQNNKIINGELQSLNDCEYSRALAYTLPEQSTLKHKLEWNAFKQVRRDFKEKLNDLFDLQGEDKPFATSDEYIKRLEVLPQKLKDLTFNVTDKELEEWVDNVISSPSLSLDEKEEIAESSSKINHEQFKKQNKFLVGEINNKISIYGEGTTKLVQKSIKVGDFFPDCPDSKLAYTQLVNCFSGNTPAYIFALELFQIKHHDKYVEKAYQKAIALDPDGAYLWNNLGNLLQAFLKRYEDAEDAYRKAIALDPDAAYSWNNLGNLLQSHLKRYEDAEDAYRKAIALDPGLVAPWNALGNLLQDFLKRYEDAEQAYRKAIALDPDAAYSWNNLGNLLQSHLKHYEDAEDAYRKAIALDPGLAAPWNALGDLLAHHLKGYDEAEKAYRQSILLDKNNPYSYENLARLLATKREEKPEIIKLYRTAIDKAENNFDILLQSHLYLGNQDLALQALEQLAKAAEEGDSIAFFRIKEQCSECYAIGLGSKLAALMQASSYAAFLQSFALALQAATGDDQVLLAAPVEVADMAKEVMLEIQKK